MHALPGDRAHEGGVARSRADHRQARQPALVSEEDWRAVQETLFLLSIPGMHGSIRAVLATPIDDLEADTGW